VTNVGVISPAAIVFHNPSGKTPTRALHRFLGPSDVGDQIRFIASRNLACYDFPGLGLGEEEASPPIILTTRYPGVEISLVVGNVCARLISQLFNHDP